MDNLSLCINTKDELSIEVAVFFNKLRKIVSWLFEVKEVQERTCMDGNRALNLALVLADEKMQYAIQL